ncbi:MAG: (d)CMP kinase [Nanoarchaeota archaeon]|nr:(d)CMP kinase [Nanoarchaeota archaeon]
MIITIAGDIGSGKSTVAKLLASRLQFKHYSTGDFMREMAVKEGISLLELSARAEKDRAVDKLLDGRQERLGKVEDNFVLDARLGWLFIPQSVKIYLKVAPKVGALRVLQRSQANKSKAEQNDQSFRQVYQQMVVRRAFENERYQKWYHVCQDDPKNYDVIIDTSTKSPRQIVLEIIEKIKK